MRTRSSRHICDLQPNALLEHNVTAPAASRPSWSAARKTLTAVVFAVVLSGAALFAWRASLSPLELWSGGTQCSATPGHDAGQLFGLALSNDLHGTSQIEILDVATVGSTGAAAPTYWIVPITDGSGGTGVLSTDNPPPHWNERVLAKNAPFRANAPANLIAELHPRLGHASLTSVRVTYRTSDGFIHETSINPRNFVGTNGNCTTP